VTRRYRRKKNIPRKKILVFPTELKQGIWAILFALFAVLIGLSFFNKAGKAGEVFIKNFNLFLGDAVFFIPLIFLLASLIFIKGIREEKTKGEEIGPTIFAIFIIVLGISSLFSLFGEEEKQGGWIGYFLSWPFLKLFGLWATAIIFLAVISIGILIFWYFLRPSFSEKEGKTFIPENEKEKDESKPSLIKKIFAPKFKTEEIYSSPVSSDSFPEEKAGHPEPSFKEERKKGPAAKPFFVYNPPPLELLEKERGAPASGDIRVNSAIIKKTLQNFGIEVTMSEVNIGPTVTQYTFKPAEGVKLSKITSLTNDLSLALASHPIRIEAPIPGRSLVGVEIPNRVRAQVRLRNLIASPNFQKSSRGLVLPLGKDVSGFPFYADLTRMPHLLVAGSTGTGKTIFLNSLIMSLLYQPSRAVRSASPSYLRFILVDPKRVEFSVYSGLPHLLCPVIYNVNQTINALKWLIKEMERRFDVLSEFKSRNIDSYNETAIKKNIDPLPYIVLIIDELADLMAAKGREIEAEIVRLAQMARAVGIHLVVATQRPSVEVITGLIKANITSRITFKVASQVDSRTVLDCSGAEKLLGAGDMLFVSTQVPKPKRLQSAFVSEKEVKKVVNYINSQEIKEDIEMDSSLISELNKTVEESSSGGFYSGDFEEDPLFEEAKNLVLETRKASASFLQRRLRIGYARAARLIDMLEEKGVIGPAEGSKPREVYLEKEKDDFSKEVQENNREEWKKI